MNIITIGPGEISNEKIQELANKGYELVIVESATPVYPIAPPAIIIDSFEPINPPRKSDNQAWHRKNRNRKF